MGQQPTTRPKTYLITGANRGLGLGFVQALLQRPDVVVYAGARDPSKATQLHDLAKRYDNLHVLKLNSADEDDNRAAAREVERISGYLDVLVANAGIAEHWATVSTASPTELHRHWLVNTLGPIVLFQSFLPLLAQSHLVPVFGCITTGAAQLSTMENLRLPNVAYGSSKVAANYVMKKIHLENEDMIAFPLAPGWVQTDLGNEGARNAGMSSAPLTVEQSVHGMLMQLDGATRETHGGKPINYDGKVLPW